MSIGPKQKDEKKFEITIADRANIAVKKIVDGFLKNPLSNILYFSLAGCMLSLLLGYKVRYEFYIILAIISVVEVYKYLANQPENIINSEINKQKKK